MKISNFSLLLMLASIVMLHTDCSKPSSPPPAPIAIVPNSPPVVDLGPDITMEIPFTYAKFDVNMSDPDNNLKSYTWNKISGPISGDGHFDYDELDSARAYWMEEGVYEFELTAADKLGLLTRDTIRISVTSNFQKYIKYSLVPDASFNTIVEIPGDIYQNLKWVYVRSLGMCEGWLSNGPDPNIDYAWGGWYYEPLADNKLSVFGGYSNGYSREEFDLIIYY